MTTSQSLDRFIWFSVRQGTPNIHMLGTEAQTFFASGKKYSQEHLNSGTLKHPWKSASEACPKLYLEDHDTGPVPFQITSSNCKTVSAEVWFQLLL